ncbi:GNAT family N-acetyltransferase [Niveibacterium microcysteis]|uniref:GNAT family N-acetyltransferase n=1 Tax=Niveibacterium microcysteis TaxID=2811415 RepID=A0ABX7M7N0_9RHOO|nr:GNAT family N-acetyltransferase [Niveibacterium microcysteis]QSI77765.1 GNAT family N-acetyltransferase [Niveibacterium microcysteis]
MAAEPKIRRAEPGDAAALARLMAPPEVFANTLQLPYPGIELWVERLKNNKPNESPLVAEVDGQIVGCAGLHREIEVRRAHAAQLGITVDLAWQGQGIGRALMTALLDTADNWLGLLRIELQVFADNARAIKLYESCGFVQEAVLKSHGLRNGDYVDTLVMARLHPKPPRLRPEIQP